MHSRIQRQHTRSGALAGRPQALFVRALLGSFLLCLALAPHATAQEGSPAAAPQRTSGTGEIQRVEQNVEKFPVINTKPFSDLLKQAREMRDAGELDLSGNLELEVEGEREEDGRLMNVQVTGVAATNPRLLQLAKDFIGATSDSRVLSVLKGVRRLALKIRLDQELSVRMLTEMPSVSEAEKMANGYNALLLLGAYNKKGRDEEVIFKSTKITTEARQIVLTFNLPRAAAGEWFSRLIRKHGTPATLPQD